MDRRNYGDSQLHPINGNLSDSHFHIAFVGETSDPILSFLAKRASDYATVIINAVYDYPTIGHGHSRNGIKEPSGHPTLEIQASMLTPTEQLLELSTRHLLRDLTKEYFVDHNNKHNAIFIENTPLSHIMKER